MLQVLVRGILLFAALALVVLWLDSNRFFDRRGGGNDPEVSKNTEIQANSAQSSALRAHIVRKSGDGHFYVEAWINNDPVTMMVDTGSSVVVLTRETAAFLGFDLWDEEFDLNVRTAGGDEVRGARVTLDEIVVGDTVVARNVTAIILMEGDMDLLGMSFLNKISGYSVEGDELVLRP